MSESKQGWIRHRGGKMPVDGEVLVHFRTRGGYRGAEVASYLTWVHDGSQSDVMAWHVSPVWEAKQAAKFDPVALRDRYTEIHAKQFELSAQISELDEEKDGIVATLKSEGFALVVV